MAQYASHSPVTLPLYPGTRRGHCWNAEGSCWCSPRGPLLRSVEQLANTIACWDLLFWHRLPWYGGYYFTHTMGGILHNAQAITGKRVSHCQPTARTRRQLAEKVQKNAFHIFFRHSDGFLLCNFKLMEKVLNGINFFSFISLPIQNLLIHWQMDVILYIDTYIHTIVIVRMIGKSVH